MNKHSCIAGICLFVACLLTGVDASAFSQQALQSIDTGYTISMVRTGQNSGRSFIVASSYEGTILRIRYDGHIAWKNTLSGYATSLGWPEDDVFTIKSLAKGNPHESRAIKSVKFISGSNGIIWKQTKEGLVIQAQGGKPCEAAYVFRIQFKK